MGIKDRFIQYIEYKRLSKRAFQASIGVSNSYIQNISNSIGADVLNRIAKTYPDLNTEWLLKGDEAGTMLNKSTEGNTNFQKPSIPYEFLQALIEERKRHDEERKRHDEMNAELIRQNGSLIRLLEEKEKTVVQTVVAKSAVKSESGLQE
ncbi:hypothetical protein [Parabacteroides distasonis]|uniref:hypothetical protein n=1 Tax=Parabacteroides distasonis TaxID=823 RepID=UPI003F1E50F3